jgi:beta-lactamase class A
LLADFYGVTNLPSEEEWSLQHYRNRFHAGSQETKRSAQTAFLDDPRDTCTPKAMVSLLALLQKGALLNQTHTDLLLASLRNSQMSPGRIKGLLPPGVTVAHKGGTLSENVINDVGLIRLPQGAGVVALAVFVKATEKTVPEHERVIAHIARSIYDYFLFVPSTR